MSRPTDARIKTWIRDAEMRAEMKGCGQEQAQVMLAIRDDLNAAVALLRDFESAIDCDVIQFGRDGECALAADGGCWEHRRRALLANHPAPAKGTQ